MLPNINLNPISRDMDTTKQLASIRSQLAQLKEAIEDELHSISYDQLDSNLRKKIDSISTAIGNVETTDLVAQTLQAKYITADQIAAQYVTTNYLTANYITASQISASYASFTWVSALDAIVGTINADYITAGQLNAVSARVSTIESNYIKTSTLESAISNLGWVRVNNLSCSSSIDIGGMNASWAYSSTLGGYYLKGTSMPAA